MGGHASPWDVGRVFLDMVGAVNLIPGPNSTQMAILIGLRKAGPAFVLPAMLITGAFAWIYFRFGTLPAVGSLFFGIKPAVVAIIIAATFLGYLLAGVPGAISATAGLALVAVERALVA